MTRVAFLDVNLLMALLTAGHLHHDLAHDWFADQRALGWATCTLTENNAGMIMGPKQVTDVYLLGLATINDGALATFDQSIPVPAVRGATKANLQVISAAPKESTSGDR